MSDDKPPIVPKAPPQANATPPSSPTMDALGSFIPAKNPDSLLSYYVGLFSILPALGLAMGPFAIWKGRSAVQRCKEDPTVTGKTHAYVGIGCGAIGLLFNLLIVAIIVAAVVSSGKK